jgi:hypothetical protein
MKVQMEDNLTAPTFHIKKELISRLRDTLLLGHVFPLKDHLRYDLAILYRGLIYTSNMHSGHNEQMNRGFGVDVLEYNQGFSLVKEISRLFSSDDLTKKTILFHGNSPWRSHPNLKISITETRLYEDTNSIVSYFPILHYSGTPSLR